MAIQGQHERSRDLLSDGDDLYLTVSTSISLLGHCAAVLQDVTRQMN